MADLLSVSINFETSHLLFPKLIGAILLLLGAAILVTHRRAIMNSGAMWSRTYAVLPTHGGPITAVTCAPKPDTTRSARNELQCLHAGRRLLGTVGP